MRLIGFSTGALARGDFRRGLHLVSAERAGAVELSALREQEVHRLMTSITELDLDSFEYVSVHAPSRLEKLDEVSVAEALRPCIDRGWNVILHPDAIRDHACWRDFGSLLCLENMDKRKHTGRTAEQLARHFDALPEASLCLDLGHARQVDSTMGVARRILAKYGSRLAQIHLSEVDSDCKHRPLSMPSVWAFQEIAHLVPECPVILESMVAPTLVRSEIAIAEKCFESAVPRGFGALPLQG